MQNYRVRALQREGAVCLRGNHEDLMIRSIETDAGMRTFLHNGGVQTVASFATLETFMDAIEWMADLPLTYKDDHRLFVHAGVRPGVPLDAQRPKDLLWIRRPFLDFPGSADGTRGRRSGSDHSYGARSSARL